MCLCVNVVRYLVGMNEPLHRRSTLFPGLLSAWFVVCSCRFLIYVWTFIFASAVNRCRLRQLHFAWTICKLVLSKSKDW